MWLVDLSTRARHVCFDDAQTIFNMAFLSSFMHLSTNTFCDELQQQSNEFHVTCKTRIHQVPYNANAHLNGNIFWGDIELRQFDYYSIFIRHKMFRIKLIIFISLFSSLFTNSYCIGRIRCGIYLFFRLFVQS